MIDVEHVVIGSFFFSFWKILFRGITTSMLYTYTECRLILDE
uniref:Uncharacterized protein n=1 Tax=Arundo donax TaxID=35708 RepID=A0A0A8YSL2_ARUDO